jgi:hypothetical protein
MGSFVTESAADNSDPRIPARAVAALEYLLPQDLPVADWKRVAEIIEAGIAAAAAGDLPGVQAVRRELVRVSPDRVDRGTGADIGKASPEVLERANVMIDALNRMRGQGGDADMDEQDR